MMSKNRLDQYIYLLSSQVNKTNTHRCEIYQFSNIFDSYNIQPFFQEFNTFKNGMVTYSFHIKKKPS